MAYLNTTSAAGNGFAAAAASFYNGLATRYAQHRLYRETYNGLRALSDRDLSDLGLHRSQLKRIALEAAQGTDV